MYLLDQCNLLAVCDIINQKQHINLQTQNEQISNAMATQIDKQWNLLCGITQTLSQRYYSNQTEKENPSL